MRTRHVLLLLLLLLAPATLGGEPHVPRVRVLDNELAAVMMNGRRDWQVNVCWQKSVNEMRARGAG